jgi:hypothetical protein
MLMSVPLVFACLGLNPCGVVHSSPPAAIVTFAPRPGALTPGAPPSLRLAIQRAGLPSFSSSRRAQPPRAMQRGPRYSKGMLVAAGVFAGLGAGALLGAAVEGDSGGDSPGFQGALIGAQIGAILGGTLAWKLVR